MYDLEDMVRSVLTSENLFMCGDLNVHVGKTLIWFEGVNGGFGYGDRNHEGIEILEFVVAYDLVVAKNSFRN
jgi:hypothetical protein